MQSDRFFSICLLLGTTLLGACGEEPQAGSGDSGVSSGPGAVGAGANTAGGVAAGGSITGGGLSLPGSTAGGTTGSTGVFIPGAFPGVNSPGAMTGSAPAGSPAGTLGGMTAGAPGGTPAGSAPIPASGDCPAATDYAAKGPFDAKVFFNVGPDGTYMLVRPDASLGKDGFKHPVVVWGNGIATTPDQYETLLSHVASHGFVVIACPSSMPERPCLNDGMEWLVKQNTAEGPMKGKLDTSKEFTMGYSWGGGAAIDTANRPNVKATISIHGMPPRETSAWSAMKSPLLLFTSTGDTFVNAEMYVTPNYNSSKVPTFYATLQESVGHLYPIDEGEISCLVDLLLGGPCAAAVKEQAPVVAWLRLWACGDENAKKYFYGADCTLCKGSWKSQNKPADSWR
jgi:Chlorophyllase enzyme